MYLYCNGQNRAQKGDFYFTTAISVYPHSETDAFLPLPFICFPSKRTERRSRSDGSACLSRQPLNEDEECVGGSVGSLHRSLASTAQGVCLSSRRVNRERTRVRWGRDRRASSSAMMEGGKELFISFSLGRPQFSVFPSPRWVLRQIQGSYQMFLVEK